MDGGGEGIRYPAETPPERGNAVEVAEGVLWLRQPLLSKLDHVNVFAFDDGDGWSLVDTGMTSRTSRAIWEDALKGPLRGKPVRRVILTHHHPDHVGNAGWFQETRGVELWTTRTAWMFARMLTLDVHDRVKPETEAFYRAAGMDAAILEKRLSERPFNFADVVWPMPLGFRSISGGDEIALGGRRWTARLGGGHAPDHLTLWSLDDDLVIGGDQLLPSISPNLGVYATEPEADPVFDWIDACERFATVAENRHLVLPGHKLPFTGLPLRLRQMIDNHRGALERLLDALDTPKAAAECFQPLFMREIREDEYGLAMVEAVAHMNHLLRRGAVTRERREDGAWLFRRT